MDAEPIPNQVVVSGHSLANLQTQCQSFRAAMETLGYTRDTARLAFSLQQKYEALIMTLVDSARKDDEHCQATDTNCSHEWSG